MAGVSFNGGVLMTPAVAVGVDDSAMANTNVSVGQVLAVIGTSERGEQGKVLEFGSASDARAVLRSGELLTAIERAFAPGGSLAGPQRVLAVRVGSNTGATATIKDSGGSTDALTLYARSLGAAGNLIRYKIEAGTTRGKKLSLTDGKTWLNADNIGRSLFSVAYSGSGTATLTVNESTVTVTVTGTGAYTSAVPLAQYETVSALVSRLNSLSGITAVVLENSGSWSTVGILDARTASALSATPVTVTADRTAVRVWFNNNPLTWAAASSQAVAGVGNTSGWVYLSGGTDVAPTNTDWQAAFDLLQVEDVQWVVPVSPTASVHAMAAAHCSAMSGSAGMERRSVVGTSTGTSDSTALAAASALGSDRVSLVHLGIYDASKKLLPPYILAAQIAGAFAGVSPGTPLTNRVITGAGMERRLRVPFDSDALLEGGVLAVAQTSTGIRILQSVSTWLEDSNYNRREVSCGVALDTVARAVREALAPLVGEKGTPRTIALAKSAVDSTLAQLAREEPIGLGVLAGDEANPAYRGVEVTLSGDVMRVEFECSPVIPVNYVLVTINAVPYTV